MRFTAKEQYGLRAMVELARRYGQGPISLGSVARTQAISLAFLEQVVMPLRAAGLLDSARGANGGYMLTRHPQSMSVGEVLRALEGDVLSFSCVSDAADPPCKRGQGACGARQVWERVQGRLADAMDATTLADLC